MRKEVIQLRCSIQEKERWIEAATAIGLELSPWIRLTLDRSLRPSQHLGAPPKKR
jgi:hypothetical protein